MDWIFQATNSEQAKNLSMALNIHPAVCARLIQIDERFTDPEAAESFLKARLANLDDPFNITHLRAAVDRVHQALVRNERIVVFGDYDVDGVSSTTLLVSILRRFGNSPHFCIPLRSEEGYGLSSNAIERALGETEKPHLFIALDCGTNSVTEITKLQEQGIDTLVVDHHQSTEEMALQGLIVNPHLFDPEDAPWRNLCTVGLTFKLVHGLIKKLRLMGDESAEQIDLRQFLDLVALGTVADLVPLKDENRILASRGLRSLYHTKRCGIHALFQVSGIDLAEVDALRPSDVAFRLGPRINASGRLSDASIPVEMLLGTDFKDCARQAAQLDSMNRERQAIERAITTEAMQNLEDLGPEALGLVAYSDDWHSGVVGIVASRVSRHYHRPAIILGEDGEMAKGSGRSIAGIDLVAVLEKCDDLLDHWGGHPMAVGVSLLPANVEAFRERFAQAIEEIYPKGLPEANIEIATKITPDMISEEFVEDIEELQPFGQSNPEPVFAIGPVTLLMPPRVFGKGHVRFQMEKKSGERISCIAWNQSHKVPPIRRPLMLAAQIGWNVWNGERNIQATVLDWRFAD